MRVVIDTNAWISRLLLADSVAARTVDKAMARFEVVVSEASVDELADVLSRKKFDRYVSLQDREEFLRRLLQVKPMVPVLSEITDCRDPKDNRFLALALDSQSDCIVSGDDDLLALNPWRGIEIASPSSESRPASRRGLGPGRMARPSACTSASRSDSIRASDSGRNVACSLVAKSRTTAARSSRPRRSREVAADASSVNSRA